MGSLAGGFSDARVLIAADLYAAAFSDNSISTKTKNMKEKVEKLRSIVQQLNTVAREGLGEDVGGGGFLGLGTKKPSQAELSKTAKELYVEGEPHGMNIFFVQTMGSRSNSISCRISR